MKLPTSQLLGRGCTLSHLLVQLSFLIQMLVLPEAWWKRPQCKWDYKEENTKPLNSRRERDIHIWRKVPFPQDISIPFICFWVWTIKAEPNAFVIRDASEGLSGGEKKSRVLLANWGISPHPTDPSLVQFLNLLCPPGPHWALSLSHTCSVWPWQSKGSSLYGAAEPKCTQESERAVYNKP